MEERKLIIDIAGLLQDLDDSLEIIKKTNEINVKMDLVEALYIKKMVLMLKEIMSKFGEYDNYNPEEMKHVDKYTNLIEIIYDANRYFEE